MKKRKWILLCLMLLGAVAFVPSLSFAYQINTFTGYVYSGVSTQFASNNDVREYHVVDNTWSLGSAYSDPGVNVDWSLTSNLSTTGFNTTGTIDWTITNRGGELNNVRFFGLLDGVIDYGSDDAVKPGTFSVIPSADPSADYWEIDDAVDGNILTNLDSGFLDDSAENTDTGYPSMALCFDIGTLFFNESFTASFTLSENPDGLHFFNDFYPGEDIYFNGLISSGPESGPPVPIPPTMILFGSGLLGLVGIRKGLHKT